MSFDMKKRENFRGYLKFCEEKDKVRNPKSFYCVSNGIPQSCFDPHDFLESFSKPIVRFVKTTRISTNDKKMTMKIKMGTCMTWA